MHIPSVFPDKVTLFGSFQLSQTLITAFVVTGILIVAALIIRFGVIRNFKQVPRGIQNVLELAVDSVNDFSRSILGEWGRSIAPYK